MPSMDMPTGPPPRLQLLLHSLHAAVHVPACLRPDGLWCSSPSCVPSGSCSQHANASIGHPSRLKSSCFPHMLTHLHLDSSQYSSPSHVCTTGLMQLAHQHIHWTPLKTEASLLLPTHANQFTLGCGLQCPSSPLECPSVLISHPEPNLMIQCMNTPPHLNSLFKPT